MLPPRPRASSAALGGVMLTVEQVMTSDVLVLSPDATLRDAVEALSARHVSGAPVLSGGRVVGILSAYDVLSFEASMPGVPTEREASESLLDDFVDWEDEADPPASYFTDLWDDAGADTTERFNSTETPEWDVLTEHTVGEAMSQTVIALPPSAPLQLAAEAMEQSGVHRVLVVDDGQLVGIVTTMDVTRMVALYAVGGSAEDETISLAAD